METPGRRLLLAFLIPLGILTSMAVIIIGIGLLLLELAHAKEELYSVPEPYAVVGALLIASAILAGATLIARRNPEA
jgi:hypothetical protein